MDLGLLSTLLNYSHEYQQGPTHCGGGKQESDVTEKQQ